MSRAPVEFELYDADGAAHSYIITPHPASEALRLVWQIVQSASAPLARLLSKDNLPKIVNAFTGEGEVELMALIENLDLDFSAASTDFFTVIMAGGGEEALTRDLLKHTFRDGKALKSGTREGDFAFDQAYMANYGEMMEACVKSVKVNRFLSLFRSSFGSILSIEEVPASDTTRSPEQPAPLT